MLTEFECNTRTGKLLQKWRKEAKISQAQMADLMNVTRQTIILLETGKVNPKLFTVFQYAYHTKHHASLSISEIEGSHLSPDQIKVTAAVADRIKSFRSDETHGLSFILFGSHGSDIRAFIHLCAMYLHCPLRDRQGIALQIINNYQIAKEKGELVCPDAFLPDEVLVSKAQQAGKKACLEGKESYYIGI